VGTIFRYGLARFRGQVIGWGLGLFLLGWAVVSPYDAILHQQESIEKIVQGMPPALRALAGDMRDIASPPRYLNLRFFNYMPLVLGIFAVLAGSGLLASDEENGTLDLVLAYPVSRAAFFTGRVLAFLASLVLILAVSWLGLVLPMLGTALKDRVSVAAVALPYLALATVLLFFAGLALLLSQVLPSRRAAGMASGMVLVASFFATTLGRMDDNLRTLARFSPLDYYQGSEILNEMRVGWLVGLLAPAVLFAALAGWRFQRRDIRVVGEGAWRLPGFVARLRAVPTPTVRG
jgi:ABC-2 type transport system permease protein